MRVLAARRNRRQLLPTGLVRRAGAGALGRVRSDYAAGVGPGSRVPTAQRPALHGVRERPRRHRHAVRRAPDPGIPRSREGRRDRRHLPEGREGATILRHAGWPRSQGTRRRPVIIVESIHKRFGAVHAVNGVSFAAHNGRVTGLLGPNGAGKTTTLRMLYALLKPDAGHIQVDDVDAIAEPQAAQSRLGVLPDGFGLYPRLTAREHIRYYGELHGLSGRALDQRAEELFELLDMQAIADRRTAGFSHGERTKVAIARALVHDPMNVLLDQPTNRLDVLSTRAVRAPASEPMSVLPDEPTSGLDVMSTRAVREIIRRLRDQGRCVLFSSHVMQEVSALCDSIVVIASGRVVAHGTADELRALSGQVSLEDAFVSLAGLSRERSAS